MIDKIADLVNADVKLFHRGRFVDTNFMVGRCQNPAARAGTPSDQGDAGSVHHARLQLPPGRITQCLGEILAAAAAAWLHRRVRAGETETHAGGRQPASVHDQPALFQGRDRGAAPEGEAMNPRFEPITGRYLHLELLGKPHRLYVEEAGQGIPLLCLHTSSVA